MKEEFKRRVLEEKIFNEIKDEPIISAEFIRRKFKGSEVDFSRLYRKLVNYQVKTYGISLNDRSEKTKLEHWRKENLIRTI